MSADRRANGPEGAAQGGAAPGPPPGPRAARAAKPGGRRLHATLNGRPSSRAVKKVEGELDFFGGRSNSRSSLTGENRGGA